MRPARRAPPPAAAQRQPAHVWYYRGLFWSLLLCLFVQRRHDPNQARERVLRERTLRPALTDRSDLLFPGLNYAACLEDSSSSSVGGGRSELVIFSSSTPGNFTREQCNSVCFAASHRYGGLGARHECLCSTNSEPNFISESQCSAACTNPQVMEVRGRAAVALSPLS